MKNVAAKEKNGFMALINTHSPNNRAPTINRSFLIRYILSVIGSHTMGLVISNCLPAVLHLLAG